MFLNGDDLCLSVIFATGSGCTATSLTLASEEGGVIFWCIDADGRMIHVRPLHEFNGEW